MLTYKQKEEIISTMYEKKAITGLSAKNLKQMRSTRDYEVFVIEKGDYVISAMYNSDGKILVGLYDSKKSTYEKKYSRPQKIKENKKIKNGRRDKKGKKFKRQEKKIKLNQSIAV